MPQTGSLIVRAYTSQAQLPVSGATVIISSPSEDGRRKVFRGTPGASRRWPGSTPGAPPPGNSRRRGRSRRGIKTWPPARSIPPGRRPPSGPTSWPRSPLHSTGSTPNTNGGVGNQLDIVAVIVAQNVHGAHALAGQLLAAPLGGRVPPPVLHLHHRPVLPRCARAGDRRHLRAPDCPGGQRAG